MKKPKKITLPYMDLLRIISAVKTEQKSYKDVDMDDEAKSYQKLGRKLRSIKKYNGKSLLPIIITY